MQDWSLALLQVSARFFMAVAAELLRLATTLAELMPSIVCSRQKWSTALHNHQHRKLESKESLFTNHKTLMAVPCQAGMHADAQAQHISRKMATRMRYVTAAASRLFSQSYFDP